MGPHLRRRGFRVTVEDVMELQAIERRHGMPAEPYVVEGHVATDLIERLLRERPSVAGVAVPSMPVGSPGTKVPGGRTDRYQVLMFDRSGKTGVFATR